MLRKNFMKRLSKSASDLSGCKKKSHSTSPEEEQKDLTAPFSTPTHNSEDEDQDRVRPSSAASTRSVPEEGYATKKAKKLKKRLWHQKEAAAPSEVGIRNVGGQIHSVYRGHQGFLSLLRERFSSRSSSRGTSSGATAANFELKASANNTPEMVRRQIQISGDALTADCTTPEIVRIRTTAALAGTACTVDNVTTTVASTTEERTESREDLVVLRRHGHIVESSCDVSQDLRTVSGAQSLTCPSTNPSNAGDYTQKIQKQMPNRQEKPANAEAPKVESFSSNAGSMESSATAGISENSMAGGLPQGTLYHLHVCLRTGRDLVARDSGGTSDPYVKFYWRNKQVYKSKTIDKELNPVWDESFILAIDDPFVPLELKVYDHDWAFRDDFMGEGNVPLSTLALDKLTDFVVDLEEEGNTEEELGQIVLGLRLVPKSEAQDNTGSLVTSHRRRGSIDTSSQKELSGLDAIKAAIGQGKRPPWSAVVNIVLVEGKDLKAMDLEGTSDPYCKVRLGNDRYKTKIIYENLNPKWYEQFDLSLLEDHSQELEVTVWDKDQRSKDDFMGRCSVDLSKLEHEITHKLWVDLEEGEGKLFILLTISGRANFDSPVPDLDAHQDEDEEVEQRRIRSFALRNTLKDLNTVGHLKVKIYCAKGLYAADLNGKSDPFVVLELDNTRLQTHTEFKTITPTWNRIFHLPIIDIHSILHISVYDEDRNHKYEFLGKFAIPLLKMDAKKRWIALRDKKLRERAKGNNPQILLQFSLHWNPIRAAIVTLNPAEEKYTATVEKFKRQVFLNNVMRIKNIIMEFVEIGKFVESCLEWESPVRTIVVFIAYTLTCYYCQTFWIPIGLFVIFLRNYILSSYLSGKLGKRHQSLMDEDSSHFDLEDEHDLIDEKNQDDIKSEEKKTLKEKLQAVQDVTALVQNALGYVAHLAEGIKNTFNFSVPFLSYLAIVVLLAIGVVLYYINLRYLLIIWGINKFSKKLIRPNYVPNNELLDFLSRVPDDEELIDYREMKLENESSSSAHASPTKKNQNVAHHQHHAEGGKKKKKS